VTSIYRLEKHAREKFLCDGYVVLVDVLALCALHEERLPIPRAFTRLIWEAANVRNRRADDIERNLKLERLNGGVEVGQEESARNWVLKGGGTFVSVFISGQKLATYGFVRCEDVLGLPSRVDLALLYFVHAFDVTLKFGGERAV
jgi:hypothetical protein